MKNSNALLALLGLLCAVTMVSSADTGWSEEFDLDNVTPGTTFELQTTDPIAASTLWVEGTARTATVTADAEGVPTITPEIFKLTEGQETCQAWDYAQIPAGTMPRDKTYTLTHDIKDGGVSKATETATVTILPEPCLALVLGLAGLMLFGRRMRKAALALVLVATMASSAATVTDVKCQQRWPWNGKVDIVYTIDDSTAEASQKFDAAFQVKNGDTVLPMNHVEGTDANPSHIMVKDLVTGTGQHVLVWDAGADFPSQNVEGLSCYVSARRYVPPPEPLGYMKIDLDTGTVTTQDNAPASWTDDDKSKYLWLRKISSGRFIMGAKDIDENHPHEVTLTKGFYIGVFALTRAQYEKIGGQHPTYYNPSYSTTTGLYPANGVTYENLRGAASDGYDWPKDGHAVASTSGLGLLRSKVKNVMKSDYLFDLPTEAQWEAACRAGHYGKYWNNGAEQNMIGSGTETTDSSLEGLAWYKNNSVVGTAKQAHEVGTKTPSSWGFYDMHGNVFEWCLDWYEDLKDADSVTDPKGPETVTDQKRLLRGGGYAGDARACRSAYRFKKEPKPTSTTATNGARIALDCD